MPVPTYDEFIEPLLRFLVEHPDGVNVADVYSAIAHRVKLSDSDRAELLPSGTQAVYKNRIGWAHDRLKRAELSESPKRGFWRITDKGYQFAATHNSLNADELEQLAIVSSDTRATPKARSRESAPSEIATPPTTSPEERIDAAITEVRERVARDLLENIGRSTPEFFEHLVLDVLHSVGYGTSRSDLLRVGGPGDGGIDGVISLDRLGLEKVYVQAKRWQKQIGSPDIQTFMGALQLQSASKGVFITTSHFSKDAIAAAAKARAQIVLVDGHRLTALMMDHGVGVSARAIQLPRVDTDYFDEL